MSIFTVVVTAGIDNYSFNRYLSNGADLSIQTDINQLAVTEGDHENSLTIQISDLYAVEIILP